MAGVLNCLNGNCNHVHGVHPSRPVSCLCFTPQDPERLEALREANRLLEEVQKGLAAYLEKKRWAVYVEDLDTFKPFSKTPQCAVAMLT
jgi:hypothetical protein